MEAAAAAVGPDRGAFAPREIGGGRDLSREELLEAPVHWPRPSLLEAPLRTLRGAGPKLSESAAGLDLETIGDVLAHLPRDHRDAAEIAGLGDLRLGEEATVLVEVRTTGRAHRVRGRRLTILEAEVADESGAAKAVWFNRAWLADRLTAGARLLLRGKLDKRGFTVSQHEFVDADPEGGAEPDRRAGTPGAQPPPGLHTTGIVPVHPAGEGVNPQRLREWAWQALGLAQHAPEALPARLRVEMRLPGVADALLACHFPERAPDAEEARNRLAFEELLLYQASLASRRSARRAGRRALRLDPGAGDAVDRWLSSLPFELTSDQRQAMAEVDADLARERPMQRLLMGEVGSGKAQPLTSLVLTPNGFRPMGEIRVGDRVINPAGGISRVTGVFPQGYREVWRLRFSDGTAVECDPDHLWKVQTSTARCRGDVPKVMTARAIASDLMRPSGSAKWHVELPEPVDLDGGGERPLDPYLVGLLLGDGGLSLPDRVRFTSADPELVKACRDALPQDCRMKKEKHRPYDWNIIGKRSCVDEELAQVRPDDTSTLVRAYQAGASQETIASRLPFSASTVRMRLMEVGVQARPSWPVRTSLVRHLEGLDLMGRGAGQKHIPPEYLVAPIAVRHAVLQGLMDTDGTLSKVGLDVSFSSVSPQLAEHVAWLVRSLGGRARCRVVRRASGTSWRTSVILPARFPPFRLARKAGRLRARTKYADPAKAIERIETAGVKPVQCIAVSHPNQLYVTDDFTVTHNTVVALHTMLRAVDNGHQAALMAPTETLAEQHFRTLQALLADSAPPLALLTSAAGRARRAELLAHLANGQLGMVVGTHALIEDDVRFASLGAVVIDEQHRFGVRQRAALDAKGPGGLAPHVLHMTATPIPRTLSMTVYGDLDTTELRRLPAGRRRVRTWVVGEERRAGAYEFVRERLREGRQAYVVCPLVSESEELEARAAEAEAERLAATELRGFSVGLVHGQMPSELKTEAMAGFAAGRIDALVATSVIEVGIDVPNASVIVIEGAERYGLSQLHQLRGRVGRGEHPSACILFGDPASEAAAARLEAIADESDGFRLAEIDLSIRGEGEILGTRQHGLPRFRAASLPEDAALLVEARRRIADLLRERGSLDDPSLGPLMAEARRRFGDERRQGIVA